MFGLIEFIFKSICLTTFPEICFQMESFPVEVLENIVKFLPPQDRKAAVLVSSRLVNASHFLD